MSYSTYFWEKQLSKSHFYHKKKSVMVLKVVTEDRFNNSEQLNRSESQS